MDWQIDFFFTVLTWIDRSLKPQTLTMTRMDVSVSQKVDTIAILQGWRREIYLAKANEFLCQILFSGHVMNIENSMTFILYQFVIQKGNFFMAVMYVLLPGGMSTILCSQTACHCDTVQTSYRYGLATDKYQNLFLYVTWLKEFQKTLWCHQTQWEIPELNGGLWLGKSSMNDFRHD